MIDALSRAIFGTDHTMTATNSEGPKLTAAKLREMYEAVVSTPMVDRPYFGRAYGGMDIISSPNVLEETTERLFPESRHRSRRVRKKLMKRFGGEFRKQPAIFLFQGRILAHPVRYAELSAALDRLEG